MISDSPAPRHQRRRQEFLKRAGSVSAVALTIGFEWAGPARRAAAAMASFARVTLFTPNAFLRIGADNSVTVIAKHLEMGQGAYTGIATIVAEELDADWSRVRVESAPADAKRYGNLALGNIQGTGGSSAMANSWTQLREAGGKARAMLLSAAAKGWHVPVAELTVSKGIVYHAGSKRETSFGSLVKTAMSLPVPETVALKDPKDFKLIGRRPPRVDVAAKVDGSAQFTLDVVMPGMLVALLKRPSQFGATVKSFDATAAAAIPGVVKVVQVPRGVAVIAKSFWAAKQGRDALRVEWDDTHAEKRSSADLMRSEYRPTRRPACGIAARTQGGRRRRKPFIRRRSHGCRRATSSPILPTHRWSRWMRSSSCPPTVARSGPAISSRRSIRRTPPKSQVWILKKSVSTRSMPEAASGGAPILARITLSKPYRSPRPSVPTARRSSWAVDPRRIDIHGGLYRPMYFHKLVAGLNEKNELTGWKHVIVGQSIMAEPPCLLR